LGNPQRADDIAAGILSWLQNTEEEMELEFMEFRTLFFNSTNASLLF
jgi:hypothetical protein